MAGRHPVGYMLARTTVVLVLLTVGYFVLPLRLAGDEPVGWVRLLVSVAAFALLGYGIRAELRVSGRKQDRDYVRIQWLLSALYGLVLTFALVDLIIATWWPGQFNGIEDKVDALYFTVTMVATVGFGDIHPTGDVARLVVTAQMLFNLVYLGTALRLLSTVRLEHDDDGGQAGDGKEVDGPA